VHNVGLCIAKVDIVAVSFVVVAGGTAAMEGLQGKGALLMPMEHVC
jgi:hypothetical protein